MAAAGIILNRSCYAARQAVSRASKRHNHSHVRYVERGTPKGEGVSIVQKAHRDADPFAVNHPLAVKLFSTPRTEDDYGTRHDFDTLWLRDQCRCSLCVDSHSGQKNFQTADIPANIAVAKVTPTDDSSLAIKWENDVKHFQSNHTTEITAEWLAINANPRRRTLRHSPSIWDRKAMEERFHLIEYKSFMESEGGLGEALVELARNGMIFLDHVPVTEKSVELIGERIGPLRETFYGRTWDVKDKPKAENVAYTSKYLGMHMDLLYMKDPPGVQLLHCLKSSCEGGESIFYDSFHAANVLLEKSRVALEDLASFPVTYTYDKGGHYFTDAKPTIEVARSDLKSKKILFENINWSPPFQGPFTHDIGLDDYGRKIRQYHLAAKAFAALVDDPSEQFIHRLRPGQCVIFLNRRILHGRKAFKSGNGERHLKGAYLNMDDFKSKLHPYWVKWVEENVAFEKRNGKRPTTLWAKRKSDIKGSTRKGLQTLAAAVVAPTPASEDEEETSEVSARRRREYISVADLHQNEAATPRFELLQEHMDPSEHFSDQPTATYAKGMAEKEKIEANGGTEPQQPVEDSLADLNLVGVRASEERQLRRLEGVRRHEFPD